jgi:2-haloalkanoic acid dehalogenase type II
MFVIFDVPGTLFSFDRVKVRFRERGIKQELADVWFARLMQCTMASALAGRYIEFKVLARSVLTQFFLQERIPERQADAMLASLMEIEPWKDAEECLHNLRADGHRLVALTNFCREDALRLLRQAGLWKWFERLYSADIVRVCKPHHALYEYLFRTLFAGPYDCCMVSAQGSDILSAEALGMNSVYVSRLEGQWPFPDNLPGLVVSSLHEAAKVVSNVFGKPADPDEALAGKGTKWYGQA